MLEFTPALVAAATSDTVTAKVVNAAADRLQDYDEAVRCEAVRAVCEVASTSATAVPPAALEAVSLRLRDTKPSVRKQAASSLLAVFTSAVSAGACAATGSVVH